MFIARRVAGLVLAGLVYYSAAAVAQDKAKPPTFPPVNPAVAKLDQAFEGLPGPAFDLAVGGEPELALIATETGGVASFTKESLPALKGAKPLILTGHQGPVVAVAYTKGPFAASAGADRKVQFWKVPEGKAAHAATSEGRVRCLAMSSDGKWLASGGEDNVVQLWDVASGKPGPKLVDHKEWVLCLAFSPDSKQLASGDLTGSIRLWDVAAGKKVAELPAKPTPPPKTPPDPVAARSLLFQPDGKALFVGTSDGPINVLNLPDGKVLRTLAGHTAPVTAMAMHPTGTLMATASKDRTVKLWNPANPAPVKNLEGHKAWVEGVAFVNQGQHVVSAGADRMVCLWDLTEPKKK